MTQLNTGILAALLTSVLLVACPTASTREADQAISAELKQMYTADQADRIPGAGAAIDWQAVNRQDGLRLARVKALIDAGQLASGADFFHAAMILQHGHSVEDALLAHDLSVVAMGKGESRARWLAAASMDRYLRRIGSLQRFGTQSAAKNNRPLRVEPTDPNVPDWLRRQFDVPAMGKDGAAPPDAARQAAASRELEQLSAADSTFPPDFSKVDWVALAALQEQRAQRAHELLGLLTSASDFFRAASLLQKVAAEPEDHLLVHDLAAIAMGKGEEKAARLAATGLDGFLKRTARLQRFGTQIDSLQPDRPRLYPVDRSVPDFLRAQFDVQPLADTIKAIESLGQPVPAAP